MRPLENSQSVTTSHAVQIGSPLTSVQNTFSRVWLPSVKRSLVSGHLR